VCAFDQEVKIPIKNLPEQLTKAIHGEIRLYSITMLISENVISDDVIPCSGTLCRYGSKFGIVTARHVWDEARKHKIIIVMTPQKPVAINTNCLHPIIPRTQDKINGVDTDVPDIAFIYLDAEAKNALEAYGKVFYSIEKRANSPRLGINNIRGYHAIFGNPKELLNNEKRIVPSLIYGTEVNFKCETNGWDYLTVDLNVAENKVIPQNSFGGVSGGGIWRRMFCYDADKDNFLLQEGIHNLLFFGVSFFETGGDNNRLIAHGPNSIYNKLDECIRTTDGSTR